jgi:hypothetical protein
MAVEVNFVKLPRKPIFFMRAIDRYPSLFATVVVLSAATTII